MRGAERGPLGADRHRPSTTRRRTFWTPTVSWRADRARWASCTSAAPDWRAATSGGRADGGEIRTASVQRRAGRAAVPHGRPGAVAAGRDVGVPGPGRHAGEGARLPHRARGDRECAARARRSARCGGGGARGRRRQTARGLRGRRGRRAGGRRCADRSCAAACRSSCRATWCHRRSWCFEACR